MMDREQTSLECFQLGAITVFLTVGGLYWLAIGHVDAFIWCFAICFGVLSYYWSKAENSDNNRG